MAEKITGIILSVTKHNDRNSIVTIYTRERGRLSFLTPVGTGRASNARRARLQPLSVIATDLNYKEATELQRLGSLSPLEVWNDLYFHPAKRAIALFLSEFLNRLLNATMADVQLFDFLIDSLRLLDTMEKGVADFHVSFLVSLLSLSGIQPDISTYQAGYAFEFESGTFVSEAVAKPPALYGEEAKNVVFVSRINFSNMKYLRLTGANRRQILYGLLNYYSYHFPGLGSLKSPEVLREIFE